MKYDIVIIILPYIYMRPQVGPALLKSNIEKHGFNCKIIDWNYKLFELSGVEDSKWMQTVATSYDNDESIKMFEKNVPLWINEIKQYNPDYIGLSINFVKFLEPLYKYILKPIREEFSNKKIVAGGGSLSLSDLGIGKQLIDKNYIDYYIMGDGEDAIVSLLKNGIWNNDNGLNRIKHLDNYPDPDYSDTLKNKYNINVPIITTRGCIRKCKFCFDVFKGSFRRSPERIANEMANLCKQYKEPIFIFNDSLSNSSTKHFTEVAQNIIDLKEKGEIPKEVKWDCNMCCFPEKENQKLMYKKIKAAGCKFIFVGVESGSSRIRDEMNKEIRTKDLLFMIDQISENKLILFMHLLIGYYTETDNDFQETIDFVKLAHKKLGKNLMIDLGPTFQIHDLDAWPQINDDGKGSWYYKNNNFPVRFERWLKLYMLCKEKNIFSLTHYKNIFYKQLLKYEDIEELKKRWIDNVD
jgi:radical SAM superfamily enzyme YgiQ (UPF0313 family)